MKFVNTFWGISTFINENEVQVIIIENKKTMGKIINELYDQINGKEGNFVVSIDNNILKFSTSVYMILEPFSINCNEKKFISKLYSELNEAANDIYYDKTNNISKDIVNYIDELINSVPYDIDFEYNFDIMSLFKIQSVRLDEKANTIAEKVINYINIVANLTGIKLLIFLNLKLFVSQDEIREIYKSAFYNKINLLLIESTESSKIENENICIIDEDNCIIV